MSGVSDGDYEHACSVWREFRIRNMGEYHDLYLRFIKKEFPEYMGKVKPERILF